MKIPKPRPMSTIEKKTCIGFRNVTLEHEIVGNYKNLHYEEIVSRIIEKAKQPGYNMSLKVVFYTFILISFLKVFVSLVRNKVRGFIRTLRNLEKGVKESGISV